MKEVSSKRVFTLTSAAVQAVFAMAFMCHKDPSIHWCAFAPLFACGTLLLIYGIKDED